MLSLGDSRLQRVGMQLGCSLQRLLRAVLEPALEVGDVHRNAQDQALVLCPAVCFWMDGLQPLGDGLHRPDQLFAEHEMDRLALRHSGGIDRCGLTKSGQKAHCELQQSRYDLTSPVV